MNRNRHQTVSATLPANTTSGNTAGYFTKGDSTLGIAPTVPTADWANGVTEELINVISESGQTPDEAVLTQLAAAIATIGKRKNLLINGNFDLWQRNITQTASGYGSADRWCSNRVTTTQVVTREAFTLGQTNVPNEPTYFYRNVITSVAGAGSNAHLQQKIGGVRTLAGAKATVSFWAKADVAKNIAVEFVQSFGTGGSPSDDVTTQGVTKFALTTGWVKYTANVTLASISGMTLGTDGNDCLILNIWLNAGSNFNARTNSIGLLSATVDIAQVQVEAGSQATSFEYVHPQANLAICQRYYQKSFELATAPAQNAGVTGATRCVSTVASTAANYGPDIAFNGRMRAAPTVTLYNPSAANAQVRNLSTGADCSGSAASGVTARSFYLDYTGDAGGVIGHRCIVHWSADAEL